MSLGTEGIAFYIVCLLGKRYVSKYYDLVSVRQVCIKGHRSVVSRAVNCYRVVICTCASSCLQSLHRRGYN